MPVPSAERDRKERPLPRLDPVVGGCLAGPAGGRVAVPGSRCWCWCLCLVGYRLRHLATQRRRAPPSPRGRRRDPAAPGPAGGGIVRRARRSARAPSRGRRLCAARSPTSYAVTPRPSNSARGGGTSSHAMSRPSRSARPATHRVAALTRTETLGLLARSRDRGARCHAFGRRGEPPITERARAAPVKMLFPLGVPRPPRVPPPHGGARAAHHRAVDPLNKEVNDALCMCCGSAATGIASARGGSDHRRVRARDPGRRRGRGRPDRVGALVGQAPDVLRPGDRQRHGDADAA